MRHIHAPARARGLSIVELLVGVAVGLFVVAGAAKLLVDNLRSNRSNLLATRVNQDLRAAADLVARDLRRAGYWQNSLDGLWDLTGAPGASSPHVSVAASGTSTLGTFAYSYAKDNDNALDSNEQFGFSVSNGVLQYQNASGSVQPITDPNAVTINSFAITSTENGLDLYEICTCFINGTCTAAQFTGVGAAYNNDANRPRVFVRQYSIVLRGQSPQDSNIKRELRETVRVRNDEMRGQCPAI
jgi:prepilin peptidase dependent protein B